MHFRGVGGKFENRNALINLCSRYGPVRDAVVRRRFDDDGNNTSWALVTMENVKSAQSILACASELPKPLTVAAFSRKQASKSKGGMRAVQTRENKPESTMQSRIATATPEQIAALDVIQKGTLMARYYQTGKRKNSK